MDSLFSVLALTTAVNDMRDPSMRMFNRHFRPVLNGVPEEKLAFDVISGSLKVLPNLNVSQPAIVRDKTGRKTVTVTAPRLAEKRIIHSSELQRVRAWGAKIALEQMKARVAREQRDMRNEVDRTLEFWASRALGGKIYDSDLTTVLVDYEMPATHLVTLAGNDLWTDVTNSNPVTKIREWKRLIEADSNHGVTNWYAWCGWKAMDCLINHTKVTELLKYLKGPQIAAEGRIASLVGVTMEEYNGSFVDNSGTTKYFLGSNEFILIGEGADVFDCPFAAVVDEDAPNGMGNVDVNGRPTLFFSKSWVEKDPSGRWIKVESRPLPVLKRPNAIIKATVCAA